MKVLLFVLVPLLLTPAFAREGEVDFRMPTEVFRNTWTSLTNKGPEHCPLQKTGLDFELQKIDGVRATITCSLVCKGQEEGQEVNLVRNFQPQPQGLRRGDGNLWASLTSTLDYWSKEVCFHHAAVSCGGMAQVASVERVGMGSGQWKFSNQLNCGKDQEVVLSPFEKTLVTNPVLPQTRREQAAPIDQGLNDLIPNWRKDFGFGHRVADELKPKEDCQKRVGGTFCYGDCISLEPGKEWQEYLASPYALGSDDYEICLDPLIEKMGNKSLPTSVKVHLCEAYFMSELKRLSVTGLTCASSRLESDCASAFLAQ
jgi:hypothetical protein